MKNQEVIDAMKLLMHGFSDLVLLLDSREDGDTLLTEDYPFDRCFMEMSMKVEKWLETTENKFKTKKPWVKPTITDTPDISNTMPQATKCEFVNTGGGTMVSIIDVINCGAVKQLMMNEEGISANEHKYEDEDESLEPLYVFDKYSELKNKFGEILADQVMYELKRYCSKYNVSTAIAGEGNKWENIFCNHNMKTLASGIYQEQVAEFIEHLDKVSEDLQDCLATTGYDVESHDITISIGGKSLQVGLNADSYDRLQQFLKEEYNEG